jgi:hypothetical protein
MRAMGSSDRQDDAIGTKARRPRVGVTRAQYQTQDFEATGGNLTPRGRIVVNVPTHYEDYADLDERIYNTHVDLGGWTVQPRALANIVRKDIDDGIVAWYGRLGG